MPPVKKAGDPLPSPEGIPYLWFASAQQGLQVPFANVIWTCVGAGVPKASVSARSRQLHPTETSPSALYGYIPKTCHQILVYGW